MAAYGSSLHLHLTSEKSLILFIMLWCCTRFVFKYSLYDGRDTAPDHFPSSANWSTMFSVNKLICNLIKCQRRLKTSMSFSTLWLHLLYINDLSKWLAVSCCITRIDMLIIRQENKTKAKTKLELEIKKLTAEKLLVLYTL